MPNKRVVVGFTNAAALTLTTDSNFLLIAKRAWLTQCASSMTKRSSTPRWYRLFSTDSSFSLALICDNTNQLPISSQLHITNLSTVFQCLCKKNIRSVKTPSHSAVILIGYKTKTHTRHVSSNKHLPSPEWHTATWSLADGNTASYRPCQRHSELYRQTNEMLESIT